MRLNSKERDRSSSGKEREREREREREKKESEEKERQCGHRSTAGEPLAVTVDKEKGVGSRGGKEEGGRDVASMPRGSPLLRAS